jgi:mitochondrial fission protein ELM1
MRALAFLLTPESWQALDRVYADIVISAGSYASAVNKLFSSGLGAKSAVILRPNIPMAKFDLVIVPEHDRIQSKQAVMIKGALFSSDGIAAKKEECSRFFKLKPGRKISLFLGGPLNSKKEFMSNLRLFLPKLKAFAVSGGYEILASTSRRTPKEAEIYLEAELSGFSQAECLVIASRANYDFVFEGFSGLSDLIFVSNESISMVSEVASMRKPCVCVSLEPEDDKRQVFLESMREGVSFLNRPYLIDSVRPKVSPILDNNKNKLREALARVF